MLNLQKATSLTNHLIPQVFYLVGHTQRLTFYLYHILNLARFDPGIQSTDFNNKLFKCDIDRILLTNYS